MQAYDQKHYIKVYLDRPLNKQYIRDVISYKILYIEKGLRLGRLALVIWVGIVESI
jgi:hypothetical protein